MPVETAPDYPLTEDTASPVVDRAQMSYGEVLIGDVVEAIDVLVPVLQRIREVVQTDERGSALRALAALEEGMPTLQLFLKTCDTMRAEVRRARAASGKSG